MLRAGLVLFILQISFVSAAWADEAAVAPQDSPSIQRVHLSFEHNDDCGHPQIMTQPLVDAFSGGFTTCFGGVQSINRLRIDQNNINRLSEDRSICNCIANERNLNISAFEDAFDEGRRKRSANTSAHPHTARILESFADLATIKRSESALHLSLLSQDLSIPEERDLVEALSQRSSQFHTSLVGLLDSERNASKLPLGGPVTTKPRMRDVFVGKDLPGKYLFDNTEQDNAEGNCVSFREFLKYEQIPEDNEFYFSLAQEGENFQQEAWDYKSIKNELARMTHNRVSQYSELSDTDFLSEAEKSKINSLISRMEFLNANPLFKHLFALSSTGEIRKHQQQLYNSMKKQFLTPGCSSGKPALTCRQELLEKRKYDDFLGEALSAISDKHIIDAIQAQQEKENLEDAQRIMDRVFSPVGDLNELWKENKLDQLHCDKDPFDPTKCVPAWGSYCGQISSSNQRGSALEQNMETAPFVFSVESKIAAPFQPSTKNQLYNEFVEKVCRTPYPNENGQTFEQYRTALCARGDKLCAPGAANRRQLLNKYLDGRDHGNKEIAALARFFRDVPFSAMTEQQAQEVSAGSRVVGGMSSYRGSLGTHADFERGFTGRTFTSARPRNDSQSTVASGERQVTPSSGSADVSPFQTSFVPTSFNSGVNSATPAMTSPPTPEQRQETERAFTSAKKQVDNLQEEEVDISERLERARQEGVQSEQLRSMERELSRVQSQLRDTQSELTRLSEIRQRQEESAVARSAAVNSDISNDSGGDENLMRRGADNGPSQTFSSSNELGRQNALPDALPGGATSLASGAREGSRPLSTSGSTGASLGVNSALLETFQFKNSNLDSNATERSQAERAVDIPLPGNLWVEVSDRKNPTAAKDFINKEINRLNLQGNRIEIFVSPQGSSSLNGIHYTVVREGNQIIDIFASVSGQRPGRSPASVPAASAPVRRHHELRHVQDAIKAAK